MTTYVLIIMCFKKNPFLLFLDTSEVKNRTYRLPPIVKQHLEGSIFLRMHFPNFCTALLHLCAVKSVSAPDRLVYFCNHILYVAVRGADVAQPVM